MVRTIDGLDFSKPAIWLVGTPATMDITSWSSLTRFPISSSTSGKTCGLTASTMASMPLIASAAFSKQCTGHCLFNRSRASAPGSATCMRSTLWRDANRLLINAVAMLPPPMNAILMLCPRECDSCFPLPKQVSANAHHGTAFRDGYLQVRRHAHRQRINIMTGSFKFFKQDFDPAEAVVLLC